MRAMILAAGLGTRMRPLTDVCPKPLLEAGGKPLIQHHIERLAACGFTELVINLAYRGEQIAAFLGDGERFGVRIHYSREGEPLETAGGIVRALPLLAPDGESPFLVVNGDIWTDFDYRRLAAGGADSAHLVLVDNPDHHPQGDFVLTAAGRCAEAGAGPRLTYSGIARLRPRLFAGCPDGARPLAPLLRAAMARGEVGAEHHRGGWVDVGTPARLAQLDQLIRQRQGA